VVEQRRACNKEVLDARNRRRKLYGAAVLAGVFLGVLSYFAYTYAVDIPQNNFHAVVWNIVAAAIWEPITLLIAKALDKFPKRVAAIRREHQTMLRRKLEETAHEDIESTEFTAISLASLTQRLYDAYRTVIGFDPDSWNMVGADRLSALRELQSEFTKIRAEYLELIETVTDKTSAYFSDASTNLQLLNDVADKIKATAIEPSFELLGDTRESLSRIRQQVHEVEFG